MQFVVGAIAHSSGVLSARPPRCEGELGDMVRPPGLSLIHYVSPRIIEGFCVDAAVCRELMGALD